MSHIFRCIIAFLCPTTFLLAFSYCTDRQLRRRVDTKPAVILKSARYLVARNEEQPFVADIGIIGGGASGMFAAASAVSRYHELATKDTTAYLKPPTIVILESTSNLMTKVQLSGGGRCNVLHDTNKPLSTILQGYPRGRKELQGIMTSEFGPVQARAWFEQRGVQLKTEADGRMFPVTDSSQTIVDTIYKAVSESEHENGAHRPDQHPALVQIERNQRVVSVQPISAAQSSSSPFYDTPFLFQVITSNMTWNFHSIIFATGSSRAGYDIATSLGHDIIAPVPSLFTLSTKGLVQPGGVFYDLAGISVRKVQITWKLDPSSSSSSASSSNSSSTARMAADSNKRTKNTLVIQQEGPLLITHVGISGPAPLRLSAFGAREFHHAQYQCNLTIHWIPDLGSKEQVENILWKFVSMYPKRKVSSYFPFQDEDKWNDESIPTPGSSSLSSLSPLLPKRLWTALVYASGLQQDIKEDDMTWGEMSKAKIRQLSKTLCEFTLPVSGKGIFKDEFVTAGGLCLKSVNMKCMESKIHSGLYFCGEMLNVDGVTGGYNFMNCWSTGYVAGKSAMDRLFATAKNDKLHSTSLL